MRRILIVSWCVIWPAAALLIGRTIYERACLGLTEPWPWLTGHPALSLMIGATYVCAHGWTMAWIVSTWGRTFSGQGARGPGVAFGQGLAMLAILAIDYSPLTPWRWIMRALGC